MKAFNAIFCLVMASAGIAAVMIDGDKTPSLSQIYTILAAGMFGVIGIVLMEGLQP